jgi:large subunit ribosomal protein L1
MNKRQTELKALVDETKAYPITEALELVKKTATAKFDESIELHLRLGIDPKKSDQQIRGTISFTKSIGKNRIVAAFVDPEKEAEAKEAGADIIGNEEVIAELIQKGNINFDVAVATPTMMPKLAKLARLLGPRGLMPNPKTDTVNQNVSKMIQEQKAGKESFKNDKASNIHQIFGRASMDVADLEENLNLIIEAIRRLRPASAKGIFIRNASISASMGPGIKIDLS